MNKPRVLCVDDEPLVLEGLLLHLGRQYEVHVAGSGQEGLDLLREKGEFAAVISDMRMPEMDGATFLSWVQGFSPDTTRLLLTGYADQESAVSAVNEGQIFRFLTKPTAPPMLRKAVEDAVERHDTVVAERVLLEKTLRGSVEVLVDVLALTNPLAFGRATRLRHRARLVAQHLDIEQLWPLEVAAMLSQIGWITVPAETLERHYHGEDLSPDERSMIAALPGIARDLLGHIPRLDPVLHILACAGPKGTALGEVRGAESVEGRILAAVLDFDTLEARGYSAARAIETMRSEGSHAARILEAMSGSGACEERWRLDRAIPLGDVREGMVLAEDVHLGSGLLLATRGYRVKAGFVKRIASHPDRAVRRRMIRIAVDAVDED